MRVSNSGNYNNLQADYLQHQKSNNSAQIVQEHTHHQSPAAAQEHLSAVASARSIARHAHPALLHEGSRGHAVQIMQRQLSRLGYRPGPADGIFGPRTEAALKRFQISRGISPTGTFDHRTDSFIDRAATLDLPRSFLREGNRGDAVADLQRALSGRGFNPGPADGIFGQRTEAALRAFQRSRGISSDGVFGAQTRAAFARGPVVWRRPSNGSSVEHGHIRPSGHGSISYNGHRVSDPIVRAKLNQISAMFGRRIIVTSGDRNYVPQGGSQTSLHLHHRAVDFHVQGLSDAYVFSRLRWSGVLRGGYEVIRHGPYTITGGPHLHIGRYGYGSSSSYRVEGTSPSNRGYYINV